MNILPYIMVVEDKTVNKVFIPSGCMYTEQYEHVWEKINKYNELAMEIQ